MMEMDGGVDGVWCGLCVWLIGVGGWCVVVWCGEVVGGGVGFVLCL